MIPSAFDSIHVVTRRRKLVSPTAPPPIPRPSSHSEKGADDLRIGPLQKMYGSGESTSHAFPPTLLRIASAPPRTTFNKLRICLRLSKADLSSQLLSFDPASSSAQFTVNNASKTSSSNAFHQVFAPEVTQQEICSNCLPELLHTVFSGSDASLLYFGGASRLKDELLYSSRPNNYGIFVAALAWTFKLITEFRERKPQFRYSVRISALHYSQKTDSLIDLFEQFNEKPGKPITVVDDPALGIRVENQTEIRVDSVDKAMFYLDRLIDHRTIDDGVPKRSYRSPISPTFVSEDEESQRGSHVFFYILVYRYKVEGNQVAGGKSRFCLMDLGLGEKHSRNGHITLSAIGNILLAIFQGQKHLPSRQNIFCQLLKESIGNSRTKSSVLLSTLPSNEEDHIIQLASRLHRATRSAVRRGKSGSDHSSVASDDKPVRRRLPVDSEQSSSEQSCAETVIFLGPSLKTKEPTPPDPPRSFRKTSEPVTIDFPRCHSAPRTPVHGPAPQPVPIDFPPFYKTASHSLPRNCTFAPPSPLRRTTHDDKFFAIQNPMATEAPPKVPKTPEVDPKKNQMIMNWLRQQENTNGSPRRFQGQQEYGHDVGGVGVPLPEKKPSFFGAKFARLATKMDSAIQCNEEDIDSEMLHVWNAARYLDDIVEDEEESLRTSSLLSSTANREALAEKTNDVNILSMDVEQISLHGNDDDADSVELEDDDLEKAMAASISSIRSHEILSRLNSVSEDPSTESHEPTEMDLYRRASHLEAYACERLREMEQEEEQKKRDKKRLAALSKAKIRQLCCQQPASAEGSSSIVDGNVLIFGNSEEDTSAATTSVSAGCSPLMPRPMARLLNGKPSEANNSLVALTSNEDLKKTPSSPTLKARLKAMWGGGGDNARKLVEVKTPKVPPTKEKWKVKQLNCCQSPSMASSATSSIPEASEASEEHVGSIPEIPPEIAQQITQQLTNYALKAKTLRQVVSSDSLSSTPLHPKLSASCQPSPVRSAALQQTLSVQNIPLEGRHHRKASASSAIPKATTRRKDSVESIRREKKASSSRVRSKERRSSLESGHSSSIPSPYSKVTNAKTVDTGAYSSGHGSDETGSVVHCRPSAASGANGGVLSGTSSRARNRESFSASSGYESADYGRYKSKGNSFDAKLVKLPVLNAKPPKPITSQAPTSPQTQAVIDHLYARRAHLQAELSAAKRRIGAAEELSRADDHYADLNPETVLETLSQETRILEKRIAACQSHVLLVTSFL
ncbi:hypothetical protein QR680_005038 [Steinernema hermaphroditum]|uniref:Kinesin motor domain-containing protein n=1 Tax=Steinernema hermaphroditum TaxID=289476 RepID=A0AA39HRW2_9BILA|nr:hypothetical protein QR680_005038 [Steinernema hermaphroditum]